MNKLNQNTSTLEQILDAVNELPEIDKSKLLPTTVTGDGFVRLDDVSEVPHDITIEAAEGTKVSVIGKNLWNEQWVIGIYNDGTGAFAPSGNRLCVSPDNPIYVKGDTYYSFNNSGKAYFNIFWFDKEGTFLKFDYISKYQFALRSPINAARLCFYMGAAYGQTYLNDIQIEEGAAWSPYEPFSATEITTPTTIKSVSPGMNFSTLPENIPISINYNKSWGMNEEYNRFWNGVFSGGNWQSKFVGSSWNDKTFRPNQNIKPTSNANNLFELCEITDLCKILNDCGVVLDTSGITARSDNMFNYAIYLTTVPYLDLRNANYSASGILRNLFSNCYELKSIEGIHLAEDGAQVLGLYAFNQCKKLEEVRFYGTIGSNGIDFQHSTKLSRASIESVVNALSSTTSGLAVTFSKTAVNNAFTTAEWNTFAATKSNWTISLV